MRQAARVTPWPNNLGWDVGSAGVDAEFGRLETGLEVRIFTRDSRIRYLFIPDPSLDPVTAVERCKREGKVEE
jgi:hypothetical protein